MAPKGQSYTSEVRMEWPIGRFPGWIAMPLETGFKPHKRKG